MNRRIVTSNLGTEQVRHRVIISEEAPSVEGQAGFQALLAMLQTLIYQPDLLRHDSACPVAIVVHPEGNAWVIEATNVAPRRG